MPSVEEYASMAPFTLDELVTAINSILRDRPALKIQARTVRFYISEGLVPPPSGGPKFARYGMEHLRKLFEIRQMIDKGHSLADASKMMDQGDGPGAGFAPVQKLNPLLRFVSQSEEPPPQINSQTVLRIPLTPLSTLEVSGRADLKSELERVKTAIDREISRLFDTK